MKGKKGSVSNMMAVLFDISYALGEAVKRPLLETVFASLTMYALMAVLGSELVYHPIVT